MKKKTGAFLDYLVLITCSVFFLLFLRAFQGEKLVSFLVLLSFVSFYIIWGFLHHRREQTLHLKNVLEYILIGFCILILLTVVFSF
ncbi:hypothetical protein A3G67_01865 [Candidatus Roizmanbacteria bacterium RIFCSPLOWO2_12_FULL_40_12]|uniref:Uncharacterized protein n=1 Tax=Candidatus Roizmanbacteria bacterium RIFCSPLOWO2_01_FULL_40_42 TaxID=1802066 RepID=A0A1F7J3H5_9BACT|nr:MAG: hypothetical protein A2779_00985 [Candidatus Roizmanbacteria bacterium RIFCSPHIGHO2_01_FULL_40_98]OGK28941.1 MAG: hypothetical protein A3C31_01625 [Candidatus Roizmanbacteria bacterium RIFCSPHIGHO2_02_FULL_40_53]OGK29593.1 MAG: hypothetical protein A2W49_03915 [Candidatus Roizmanbacteria bacterium RIFCSPHIGHO2_12_41_18]OGK36702.1 MAG: hypothetical protein A3E69_03825 [Candidatus Roizmanbacteria bacterium RIFCSPHIGHO2_12_FULL_40_130]OGK50170.1 MAG: hypothetical protein A3B50_00080 [Candi